MLINDKGGIMYLFEQPLYQPDKTLIVCVDIQERLMKVIAESQRVIDNGNKILQAAKILSIPLFVSEQYTKGLGKTILENYTDFPCFEKLTFSVFCNEDMVSFISKSSFKTIVFFGIESHVCIFQSLKHARLLHLETVVIADACSSRNLSNHHLAIENAAREGVSVISTESFLFGSLQSCKDEHFKAISNLVK